MSAPACELPQLREALVRAAERQVAQAQGEPLPSDARGMERHSLRRPPRLRRSTARRGSVGLLFAVGLLLAAAVAYATTQLIQTGSPVRSEEPFSANTGVGVAIPQTEGLLGIAAPDPAGGPPWTMRVYDTSRGLGCAQVGRLVGGRIGVLGIDGAFGDDGRFHPLPAQASQAEGSCVLLDAHGHAFLGVGTYDEPASGLPRECHLLGSRAAGESCSRSDPRDVFYGLLGPAARSITYTAEGRTRTVPTVSSDGAYLIVERGPAQLAALGVESGGAGALPAGGGSVSGRGGLHMALHQPIRKIAYTHGRTCALTSHGFRDGHGGDCLPPVGYVPQRIRVPNARELASPVHAELAVDRPVPGRPGARQAELLVTFIARVAVTSALGGYSVFVQEPDGGRCAGRNVGIGSGQALARNVKAGERVQVAVPSAFQSPSSMFPGCPGTALGTVSYSVPSEDLSSGASFDLLTPGHARTVVVGHFTYDDP
ncbi:MAG TPA: hypothetical protein VK790_13515 [Solirubrobacteraceae bacterium]|jgi:hypothetical protein|nr:hypothetical protein [Solirubrobacteraceae bacterium]